MGTYKSKKKVTFNCVSELDSFVLHTKTSPANKRTVCGSDNNKLAILW